MKSINTQALSVPVLAEALSITKVERHPFVDLETKGRVAIRTYITLLFVVFCFSLFANPNAPVVSNVVVSQRTDGSKLVDIYYDLFDANEDLCNITLKVSGNNGTSYGIIPNPANLSGDSGPGQPNGTNKHMIWDIGATTYVLEGNSFLYRVYADDGSSPPVPENFVFIPGGTVAGITVSDIYIDMYELTQSGYQAVMGVNPSYFGGNLNHPVEYVSWFNAIEYSNRRSIQEGLTPCYSYSTFGTNPANWPAGWNTINANQVNVNCNFSALGYRLLTEAEWEYVARGGLQTQNYNYSGSDDINSVAWYSDNNIPNGTKAVSTKAPNELGLYDMSGNVWEWCWNRYSSSSTGRAIRGGSWNDEAAGCTVSVRLNSGAAGSSNGVGFRLARTFPLM